LSEDGWTQKRFEVLTDRCVVNLGRLSWSHMVRVSGFFLRHRCQGEI
jgi:hypothetical protein